MGRYLLVVKYQPQRSFVRGGLMSIPEYLWAMDIGITTLFWGRSEHVPRH